MQNYRTLLVAVATLLGPGACHHAHHPAPRPATVPHAAIIALPEPVAKNEADETPQQIREQTHASARAFVEALLDNDVDRALTLAHAEPQRRWVIEAMALNLHSEKVVADAMLSRFVEYTPQSSPQAMLGAIESAEMTLISSDQAELSCSLADQVLPLRRIDGVWKVDIELLATRFELPRELLTLARQKAAIADELANEIRSGTYRSPIAVQLARLQKMTSLADAELAQVQE